MSKNIKSRYHKPVKGNGINNSELVQDHRNNHVLTILKKLDYIIDNNGMILFLMCSTNKCTILSIIHSNLELQECILEHVNCKYNHPEVVEQFDAYQDMGKLMDSIYYQYMNGHDIVHEIELLTYKANEIITVLSDTDLSRI